MIISEVDVLAFYRALLTKLSQPKALEFMQLFVNNWMGESALLANKMPPTGQLTRVVLGASS